MGREVLADHVPIPSAALGAADAVVIVEAELVHGWQFNPCGPHDSVAISFPQASFNQGERHGQLEIVSTESVCSALLFNREAKDVYVVWFLESEPHGLFQFAGAGRALAASDIPALLPHVPSCAPFWVMERNQLPAVPALAISREPGIVGVLSRQVDARHNGRRNALERQRAGYRRGIAA